MTDLVAFLRARLDEREAKARAAAEDTGSGHWHYDPAGHVLSRYEGDFVATGSQDFLEPERGEFIADNDPAGVLAEVDAIRAVVDWVVEARAFFWDTDGTLMPSGYRILGPLAAVYADHPDYRKEWRP